MLLYDINCIILAVTLNAIKMKKVQKVEYLIVPLDMNIWYNVAVLYKLYYTSGKLKSWQSREGAEGACIWIY